MKYANAALLLLQPSQDILASYASDAYPAAPERKGPVTDKMLEKFVEAEMEDEYCALPFNHDPEYAVSNTRSPHNL